VTSGLSSSSAEAGRLPGAPARMPWIPPDLLDDVLSDHAGETGAVFIYRGILSVTGDPDLRRFAREHLQTEQHHLSLMDALLPTAQRSRLLPVWRFAGWLIGGTARDLCGLCRLPHDRFGRDLCLSALR